jgi:hypothetical protein
MIAAKREIMRKKEMKFSSQDCDDDTLLMIHVMQEHKFHSMAMLQQFPRAVKFLANRKNIHQADRPSMVPVALQYTEAKFHLDHDFIGIAIFMI